jgi:predicted Fe-Mo cluster-binding NifX family protein
MKICIPAEDDRGLDARLCDHFGSAPCFAFYDTASGELEVLIHDGGHHAPGQCEPTGHLASRGVEAVVCRGLGRRALDRLTALGVEVLVTRETTVRAAVEALASGRLPAMGAGEACGGGRGHCDPQGPPGR